MGTATETKVMQRGDRYMTGGLFVGISRGGVVWICYEETGESFARMVMAFDRMYAKGGAQ